jgi:hypothetical protein
VIVSRLPPEITSSVDCPSNTTVDNVNLSVGLGEFKVWVDDTVLDIATTVKVKCTISTFRKTRQLELKRISIVQTTTEEAAAWAELAAFKRDVLSRPWHLDRLTLQKLNADERAAKQEERDELKRRAEREVGRRTRRKTYEEKMRVYTEKVERRRRKEEVMMNAGALEGSNVLPWPP